MRVRIAQADQAVLLHRPLTAPLLVGLDKRHETALALRVTELFSFRRENLPITIRLVGYQGKEGVWLVVVAFRIAGTPTAVLEGKADLNPRQAEDYRLLQYLATQERFPVLFVSATLKVAVGKEVVWAYQDRREVRLLLAQIDHSCHYKRRGGQEDSEFEAVRQEFHTRYAAKTLLSGRASTGVRVSSPFQGVVLD